MKLEGELANAQVKRLWQHRDPWWHHDTLDLHEVTAIDSAGLALLVKWAKATLTRGATPALVGASDDFYTLARLYGVASLFAGAPSNIEDV